MPKSTRKRLLAISSLTAVSFLFLPGCGVVRRAHANRQVLQVNPGDQPDKVLFEKATKEIQHGRYDVGRLTLQTLLNTYPDSEYLAKTKLAIADSYYNEGGVSGLTESENEYKDFITFFPTAPEAPEAQYRVGMAHYRLMAKADRDQTEAKLAEAELKEFLLKYPDSPVMPRVKARLREAQEVLAEGDYKTASFYMMRNAYLAARSRYQEIVEKYPNFSRGDDALYHLGQTLERLRKPQEAAPYYARLISDFPLSTYVPDAKARLQALHHPIPRPTRATLARAQADALRQHHRPLLGRMTGLMAGGPDTSATLHGPVHLGPQPAEVVLAKTPSPAAPTPNASIVAQPVGESSLKAGKPVDPKSENTNAAQGESAKAQESSTPNDEHNPSGIATPTKKKGKFHVFKKLIPF